MTRHRKFLKSEKTKTKLKGAKLPKGLNVTKTEFKVRKIVIRDQIKDPTVIADGTIVKSNIKDLLTKLQHHSATNRNEGLRYLKEMVTFHQQEASKHLGSILQGICQLALDIEKDVRRECFKALNVVFAANSADLIAPFFNVVTSYLRCAMTHINMHIQEDSLHFLDCLLIYTPALVAANSDSLFQCFLDMISKLRTESKLERTLTTNLGSKLTSVKWRSNAFDRLLGILRAIVANRRSATQSITSNEDQLVNAPVDDAFKQPLERSKIVSRHNAQHFYNPDEEFYFSLTRKQLNKYCDIPSLFRKTIGNSAGGAPILAGERDEGQRIRKYVELLMPLLFETWMEVRPAKLNATLAAADFDEDEIFVSNDAAVSLKIILEIIDQLLELVFMYNQDVSNDDLLDCFRKKYGQEFCSQFLRGFPYHQGDGFKGSKRKSKGMATEQDVFEAGGQKCLQQNFNISYIFWILNSKTPQNSSVWGKKLMEYLKQNLPHIETQTPECLQIVVKLLRTVLVDNAISCLNSTPTTRDLLDCVLTTYQKGKFPKEIRTKGLIMLCDIVLDHRLHSAYGAQIFSSWLPTLPKMLAQPFVSSHVLKTFSHLARQRNQIFLEHLQANQESIISNLATVQISGVENQLEAKQLIVNLFYWLDTIKLNELCELKSTLTTEWPMVEKLIEVKKMLLTN